MDGSLRLRLELEGGNVGYDAAKTIVADGLVETFSRAADAYQEWLKRESELEDILEQGARVARLELLDTLDRLREAGL
jgi:hypothetical protein